MMGDAIFGTPAPKKQFDYDELFYVQAMNADPGSGKLAKNLIFKFLILNFYRQP